MKMNTKLTIDKSRFRINGRLTYEEIPGSSSSVHGLLMNARFIQGIFDSKDRKPFNRFGAGEYDPERQTQSLIGALPQWYAAGLRGITVGFQGGGPCFTVNNEDIDNNPFGADGAEMDPAYFDRMDRLIRAADEIGFVVIVSLFYGAQAVRIKDDAGIRRAVKNCSNWLRDGGYTNVIIEIANEHSLAVFEQHPILHNPGGIVELMKSARHESGGIPVACSDAGGLYSRQIVENSDVVLIHGNGQTRQRLYNMICDCQAINPDVPIVVNEDSQAISNLPVAMRCGASWGYYNNMTKQEPPTNWSITPGEDTFFAVRMARALGIDIPEPPIDEQFYLQGLGPLATVDGKRWVRLASLYPERINHVDFYRNGELMGTTYDDPFTLYYDSNWRQGAVGNIEAEAEWQAAITLRNNEIIERSATVCD